MNNNFDEILFHVDATLLDCQKNKITTEKIIYPINYCIAAIPQIICNNHNNGTVVHLLTLFSLGSFFFFWIFIFWDVNC